MSPIVKNILAVIAGIFVGGFVNMGIIIVGNIMIPPPEGVDVTTAESLKASIHLFKPYHFFIPFLAHSAGAFFGALLASIISASHHIKFALAIGVFFLFGGIMATYQISAPTWFAVLDLVFAYLPMAWLGWKISGKE